MNLTIAKLKNISANQAINYLFVLYALAVPISKALIIFTTILMAIIWFFSDNLKQKLNFLKSNTTLLFLLAFVVVSLFSLLWSNDPVGGLVYIRKYWYFLIIPIVATTIEKKYLEFAISAFLIGMFLSELLSYAIFFELIQWKETTPQDPSPFMNHIQYSMFLAFTSLLLLNRYFFHESTKLKILYLVFFITATSNLFINGGRTGQIAFLFSIFLVTLFHIKNKFMAILGTVVIIIATLFMAYNFSPNFKYRAAVGIEDFQKMVEQENYCTSLGLRVGVLKIGSEIFLDNPLFGIGITNDMNTAHEYISKHTSHMKCVETMPTYHNCFMQVAVDLGIFGLFLYIMIFYSLVKLKIQEKEYKNLIIIFVSVFTISSFSINMIHIIFPMSLFSLFVGIFIAQNRIEHAA
ncbi:MAG: O-antigen ligase [Campylobacterota bacterium]|nr:O-antigen ligase [Campylobacterota bacterium]MDQ1337711.1 O-antigen ligase [Campylobacterota bacterium]